MVYNIPIINKGFCDLNPLLLGWEDCEPNHCFGPSIRSYYLIHYVVSGCGTLENCDGSFQIHSGQIFIIRPGEVTKYTADKNNPWSYIWVAFDGKLASKIDLLEKQVVSYPWDTFFTLRRAQTLKGTREEFVVGQLFSMFSLLLDSEQKSPGYTQQAADYIRSNYMNPIRIEDLSLALGLNRRYLSRIFKKDYGISLQEFLIKTRLENSTIYLKQGKSVSETALLSGYPDSFNFSKMFKKHFGISPFSYKNL